MGIIDIFSKRQRRLGGEVPDVYQYTKIPYELKVQIVHIIRDEITPSPYKDEFEITNGGSIVIEITKAGIYKDIHDTLCREYGLFNLTNDEEYQDSVFNFFLAEKSIEKTLDVIELCFGRIVYQGTFCNSFQDEINNTLAELNARFKEHGVGYQFESSQIIRVDSEFLHTEAVKPTLLLLRGSDYKGANDEFLSAHEHYRHGRYKECLVELLKALESTMKTICQKRGWPTTSTDNASKLIKICFEENLLPAYLESEITSLRTLLESGVPTIRNKRAGHGQGVDIVTVPAYLARYALNLTASSILFLIEAETA